jgi:hypothetical protein
MLPVPTDSDPESAEERLIAVLEALVIQLGLLASAIASLGETTERRAA